MKNQPEEKIQTEAEIAYHEAGHAVASYYTGVRFKKVSIVPKGCSLGRLVHRKISEKMIQELHRRDNTKTQIWHINHMIISLAGAATTQLFFGRSRGHLEDYTIVNDLAFWECGTVRTANAYSKFLRLLTKDLIKYMRKLLDIVAKELLEKKTLTYKEFIKLIPESDTLDSGDY